jgi:glutathione synthase/RimK-type ligase-like ATP-grasp enzyme
VRRCAFLTLEDREGFFIDDHLAHEPFRTLGWEVHEVPWRQPAAVWKEFDAVLIRSAWDYQTDVPSFLGVLDEIEASEVPLFNPLNLVRWNLNKTYLQELELRGIPIVPTEWRDGLDAGTLPDLFREVGSDQIVLKPLVGANADGLVCLSLGAAHRRHEAVEAFFRDRPLMAQPVVEAILQEGEYSLFYFNGQLSHSILKKAKAGDLRVQEEYGGRPTPIAPSPALVAAGSAAIHAVPEVPLYARVDLVRANDGAGFWLMELELIEPALYLRMHSEASDRFASAFHRRILEYTGDSGDS